jgi:hypothetical protein
MTLKQANWEYYDDKGHLVEGEEPAYSHEQYLRDASQFLKVAKLVLKNPRPMAVIHMGEKDGQS